MSYIGTTAPIVKIIGAPRHVVDSRRAGPEPKRNREFAFGRAASSAETFPGQGIRRDPDASNTCITAPWLNIECAFSKMARTFLRHIRVASTAEPRILQGIAEMNEAPVQFRWHNFDLGIA